MISNPYGGRWIASPPAPRNHKRRVLLISLKFLGWLAARVPEPVLRFLASAMGNFVFYCLPRRRRLVLSNLDHAFPQQTNAWRQAIGRESCRRLIETALLSLATPFLPESRCREIVSVAPQLLEVFARHQRDPAATLICSPHLAYWEVQTAMALAIPGAFPEFGTIYRPLNNPAVDAFVKSSRERFGLRLLSRKEGFAEALRILRRRGLVGILFDQNAGMGGALTTLFGRVCSTTELPGLMAEKFNARVYGLAPRRKAFWRVEIGAHPIAHDGSSNAVTFGLNRWLEELLATDDNLCASWLWVHSRWRNQDVPARRFRLEAKRNLLAADLAGRGCNAPPRRTRVWIRLPNWLGDVVMTLPLLRALRASRPDAEITLVAKKQFMPLLESWAIADRLHPLPPRGPGYFRHFRSLRHAYPDVWLLFTSSIRADLEAWLTGCPQRFGLSRAGRWRPLLTHAYRPPGDLAIARHQLDLWENFLRHFGLHGPVDRTPVSNSAAGLPAQAPIGLICGSENLPLKRWPVSHWRALIAELPDQNFVLFGTANDTPITRAVAAGFPPGRVRDAAGETDLAGFARELGRCRLLITNDTGGMHLANALGVPLIALFGPTNPIRTAPVFGGPVKVLQPPGCPPAGGGRLSDLPVTMVVAEVTAGA